MLAIFVGGDYDIEDKNDRSIVWRFAKPKGKISLPF
jgi:hypothetical protein